MRRSAGRVALLAGLLGVSVALTVLSLAVVQARGGELRSYLDVIEEANLPTWWSTVLLCVAALAHGLAGLAATTARAPGGAFWFLGAVVVAVLSLAEHTGLHDRLDGLGGQLLGAGPFADDWLPLGAVAGLGVTAALALVAARVAGGPRWLLGAGAAVLLAGALGGELAVRLLLARGGPGTGYVLTYHVAELAENVGALLLLAAAAGALTLTRDGAVLRLHYRTAPVVVATGSRA